MPYFQGRFASSYNFSGIFVNVANYKNVKWLRIIKTTTKIQLVPLVMLTGNGTAGN